MQSRWFSPRALLLHVGLILWVTGCIAAGWWQIARAMEGNALSFVYAIEWPVFAAAGVVGWWALIHSTAPSEAERAERKAFEEEQRMNAQAAKRRPDEEDDAMRAYNDHLAQLSGLDVPPKKEI